ncbi:hypothetical protein O0L34_g7378 [Tuta absoluta]|nr:hypothetical protein O0L34_g7378 [Tuta absoluta]
MYWSRSAQMKRSCTVAACAGAGNNGGDKSAAARRRRRTTLYPHCATLRPSAGPLLCLPQHGNVVNCHIHQDELLNPPPGRARAHTAIERYTLINRPRRNMRNIS